MSAPKTPRIHRLVVDAPATLCVTWHDGTATRHALAAMLRAPWAAPLRDPAIFATATVEDGWQIVWPGTDAAISAQGLWDDVHPPADAA